MMAIGPSGVLGGLTAAETRVAELVARGENNGAIAAALAVRRKTVEWHLSNIYRKAGVHSRTQLALELLSAQRRAGVAAGAGHAHRGGGAR